MSVSRTCRQGVSNAVSSYSILEYFRPSFFHYSRMDRPRRSAGGGSPRHARNINLGNFVQLLRDADYGRLHKVLESIQGMSNNDLHTVSGNILVRGIARCNVTKLPTLLQIIDHIAFETKDVNARGTLGGITTYPLVRASYQGLAPVVDRLLAHDADLLLLAGDSPATMDSCFSASIRTNKLDVLERLLHASANARAADSLNGLLVQALWQAYDQNNVQACQLLVAHGAVVDNVFASMLFVLEEDGRKGNRFARFAMAAGGPECLASSRPRPWFLPCAYTRGAATLFMCVRRHVASFPVELFDHILTFLPCEPTGFIDDAVLKASLPRRDYRASSSKFAILSLRRPKDGDPVWS
jgi:hypothetical protein